MDRKVKVWDLAVRLGHWMMGALVLGAFLTAEDDDTIPLHTRLGLALLGIIVFRLVWGFVGSTQARFKSFVRSPREVLAYAKAYVRGRPGAHLGHNPLGGVMVVALLGTLLVITLTGIVTFLGPEWDGPLSGVLGKSGAHAVKEVHEAAAGLLLGLVGFHVAGVLLSSFLEKQNLVAGMVTGRKHAPPESEPPKEPSLGARVAGFIAAAGLGAAVVLLILRLFPLGEAEAATAQTQLIDQYQQEARAQDPGHTADPARGKALYFARHDKGGEKTSCATCHAEDPRAQGRSPAGKRIDPLAPGANPERFTDRKKADRWFDRNCKQVMGRPCTPGEKADLIAWLLTF